MKNFASSSLKRRILFWAGVIFLTLSCLSVPEVGPLLKDDVDSSLSTVLHYAHQHQLKHGTDIVFTYGPLGFLTFFYYFPHAFGFQLVAHVCLCFTTATGLCLVAARLPFFWRWLLLATFLWVGTNAWPRTDLMLYTSLFAWGVLSFVESENRLMISVCVFAVMAAFDGLTKISFLLMGSGSVLVLAADLVIRRQKAPAILIVAVYLGCLFVGWLAAGQELRQIGAFLVNSLSAVRSYNAVMGWEGVALIRWRGFVWVLLGLGFVLWRTWTAFEFQSKQTLVRRFLLCGWALFFFFTIWKHGFVRLDRFHVIMALPFAPVLPLMLSALPSQLERGKWVLLVLTILCWLMPTMILYEFFFPPFWPTVKQALTSAGTHTMCLAKPDACHQRLDDALDRNRAAALLPACRELIGSSSVDVFGQDPGYAVFNNLNYHPRPVFESYFAANQLLETINERFYLSPRAPEFVLFRLAPLDFRMPALEDARALVHILCNSDFVAAEGPFLLLRVTGSSEVRKTLLAEGAVRPHEPINLQAYADTNLWMEIVLQPTISGRLRQWAYHAPTVRLAAWESPGGKRIVRDRSPPVMLQAGFLASPLLLGNEDVLKLFNHGPKTRPGAYSVELQPGEEYFWHSQIKWRVYRVETRLP